MSKRGHGEGSIFQRADGRWVARIEVQGIGRKRKEMSGVTRREVQQKLARAQRAVQDGLPVPSERQKVGAFLENWLKAVARPSVRPSTYRRYRELLQIHIIPAVGGRKLKHLEPEELQLLYSRKLLEGLAPRTVGHIHRVLHRALQDALRWGIVGRNVCDVVRPPRVPAQEMAFLEPEAARQLLAAAEGDPLEALFMLAITAGLRQGELLALKWPDVDLDAGVLHVRRAVRYMSRRGAGAGEPSGFVESEPKSAKSRRSVSLTSSAVAALRRQRARQLEYRLQAGAWEDTGLVFTNEVGRHLDARNVVRRSFLPLLERAGLQRIRFHDLRHTAATLFLAQGVHPRVVQEILGHSTVDLTLNVYSHVLPNLQREAADKMETLLGSR